MKLPGCKLPKVMQGILYYQNPYKFLLNCRKKYGKTFSIKLPGFSPMVVVTEPKEVKRIFTADFNHLFAGEANTVYFSDVFGKFSLLTLDGAKHLQQRKLISRPLHSQALKNYGDKIIKITENISTAWPQNKTFKLLPGLQAITLQVIMAVFFGIEKSKFFDELHVALSKLLESAESPFSSYMTGIFPQLLNYPSPRIRKLLKKIAALLLELIQYRRLHPSDDSDVLNLLIEAKDENSFGLTDEELQNELLTLLFAGHETTANTAAWAVYNSVIYPEINKKIKLEIDEITNNKLIPSIEEIKKLSYLQNVIKETLRYQAILPIVARVLHQPWHIGDFEIAAGNTLVPCNYLAGNDPDFWKNPQQFFPDRFSEVEIDPYNYFPFGGGLRRCIGASFAMFELQIILGQLFHQFEISIKPGYKIRPVRRGISFAPCGGLPIKIRSRF